MDEFGWKSGPDKGRVFIYYSQDYSGAVEIFRGIGGPPGQIENRWSAVGRKFALFYISET